MLTRVQAFEKLRANVELTGLQEKTVAARHTSVRAAVRHQLTVTDDFLTGSYRRQTLIRPLSRADVDIMVELDRSYRERGPREVLNLVRKALLVEYPKTAISRNGQAVTVTFSDFTVDVVPAFKIPWWGWNSGYWEICDSGSDSWIVTNPKEHEAILAMANKVHNGNLVPCIKQLKAWNRTSAEPLRSFHLEILAWTVFGRSSLWHHSMKSDWVSLQYFFNKAPGKLRYQLADPAGNGSDLGSYLNNKARERAIEEAESAGECCIRAEAAAKAENLAAMHAEYRKIFGDYYPC